LIGREKDSFTLTWSDYTLCLGQRTHIMGILNVTPDSFSDGGRYFKRDLAIKHGLAMAKDGADIIDVGGESTRPYAEKVSLREELDRVIPVVQGLNKELRIPISIDTLKAEVAEEALKAGASIINDTSALRFDSRMISVAAKAAVPVILMHMKGTPSDMQDNPVYNHLIPEIKDFLSSAMDRAVEGGVEKSRIILDPGIGFGKTFDHNLEIIRDLHQFLSLGRPILLGTSRKAFLGKLLDKNAHERDIGTMATIAAGVMNGASIIRVHNVKMALETIKVIDAVRNVCPACPSKKGG
jgi:dihydropteroate synthase